MLALIFCMSLAVCNEPPRMPLRVGVNPWLGYEPLVLAREQKLRDPATVRVVELESTSESVRQLRNGRLHEVALGLQQLADDLRARHSVMNQPDWRLLFDKRAAEKALVEEVAR